MKRLLALLLAALLTLGSAACEAPGAPDTVTGGNNPEDGDAADTQLTGEDEEDDDAEGGGEGEGGDAEGEGGGG